VITAKPPPNITVAASMRVWNCTEEGLAVSSAMENHHLSHITIIITAYLSVALLPLPKGITTSTMLMERKSTEISVDYSLLK